jgi:hypothetical protein
MKSYMYLMISSVLIAVFIFFNSCENPETVVLDGITYPESTENGDNILFMPDSAIVYTDVYYSFSATLERDAELKVIMTNYTNNDTVTSSANFGCWFISSNGNTGMSNYSYDEDKDEQIFVATVDGLNDLKMSFGASGSCRIDIYENGSDSVSQSKYLFWQRSSVVR